MENLPWHLRPEDDDNRKTIETFSPSEAGKKLHALGQTGYFEATSIDEDALRAALSTFLQTGDLEDTLSFFDRSDEPELEEEFGLNGRRAFREALRRMDIDIDVPDA